MTPDRSRVVFGISICHGNSLIISMNTDDRTWSAGSSSPKYDYDTQVLANAIEKDYGLEIPRDVASWMKGAPAWQLFESRRLAP
jgi:hypothetical protein